VASSIDPKRRFRARSRTCRALVAGVGGLGLVAGWLALPAAAACAPGPSIRAMAKDASVLTEDDSIFVGTPTRILPAVESNLGEFNDTAVFTPVEVRIEAAIRGSIPRRVIVMDVGGTLANGQGVGGEGTVGFRIGRRYVVAGARDADGTYRVDACTESGQISAAEAQRLVRLAGGAGATRPSPGPVVLPDVAGGRTGRGGSNTLTIFLALLAGATVSTAIVLGRRRRAGRRATRSVGTLG
jgi:hypothetical protein